MLLCCLILFAAVSVLLGVERLDLASLFHPGAGNRDVLWISRIPRTVTLILTGAGLSICGVILQQLTQNKFISPTTAGTLDAAKLGIYDSAFCHNLSICLCMVSHPIALHAHPICQDSSGLCHLHRFADHSE